MNKKQAQIIGELLRLSIENGFNCGYPIQPIVEKFNIEDDVYNEFDELGLLWDYANHTMGAIWISEDNDGELYASVDWDQHDILECWVRNANRENEE